MNDMVYYNWIIIKFIFLNYFIIFLDINAYKDTSDDYKEMLETEKKEKNITVDKIKSLFRKMGWKI